MIKNKKKRKKKVSKLVKKKVKEIKERTIVCVDCNRGVKIKRYKGKDKTYRCAKCRALKTKSEVNDKGQYVTAGKKESERNND